ILVNDSSRKRASRSRDDGSGRAGDGFENDLSDALFRSIDFDYIVRLEHYVLLLAFFDQIVIDGDDLAVFRVFLQTIDLDLFRFGFAVDAADHRQRLRKRKSAVFEKNSGRLANFAGEINRRSAVDDDDIARQNDRIGVVLTLFDAVQTVKPRRHI